VKSIETGVWGAYQNVLTNLKDVKDEAVREKVGSAYNHMYSIQGDIKKLSYMPL